MLDEHRPTVGLLATAVMLMLAGRGPKEHGRKRFVELIRALIAKY